MEPTLQFNPAPRACRPWLQRWQQFFVAALLVATLLPAAAKPDPAVEIGANLREATLQGLNGPERKLSDLRGKPLLINVWASWCEPCRQEMASLERLAWRDQSFNVIGISTDDDPAAAKAWLKRSNANISHFIDRALLLEHMLGASRLPVTLLVDANGRLLARIYGARQWDSRENIELISKTFGSRKISP